MRSSRARGGLVAAVVAWCGLAGCATETAELRQQRVDELRARRVLIEELQADVAEVHRRFDVASQEIAQGRAQVGEVTAQMAPIRAELNALRRLWVEERLEAQSSLDRTSVQINRLESLVRALQAELEKLEQSFLAWLERSSAASEGTLQDLRQR